MLVSSSARQLVSSSAHREACERAPIGCISRERSLQGGFPHHRCLTHRTSRGHRSMRERSIVVGAVSALKRIERTRERLCDPEAATFPSTRPRPMAPTSLTRARTDPRHHRRARPPHDETSPPRSARAPGPGVPRSLRLAPATARSRYHSLPLPRTPPGPAGAHRGLSFGGHDRWRGVGGHRPQKFSESAHAPSRRGRLGWQARPFGPRRTHGAWRGGHPSVPAASAAAPDALRRAARAAPGRRYM